MMSAAAERGAHQRSFTRLVPGHPAGIQSDVSEGTGGAKAEL